MLKSLWAILAILFIGSVFTEKAFAYDEGEDSSAEMGTRVKRRQKRIVVEEYEEESAPVSTERPNSLSIELLGRGFLWGVAYDRSLGEHFAVGVGYSGWKIDAGFYKDDITVVPVYVNYYFTPNNHRGFLTGGLTYVRAKSEYTGKSYYSSEGDRLFSTSSSNSDDSTAIGTLGGGYEYRGWGGFLFRAAIYEFVQKTTLTWFGLSLGATF